MSYLLSDGILEQNKAIIMHTDDLVSCVARSSPAIVLALKDKRAIVFFVEGF